MKRVVSFLVTFLIIFTILINTASCRNPFTKIELTQEDVETIMADVRTEIANKFDYLEVELSTKDSEGKELSHEKIFIHKDEDISKIKDFAVIIYREYSSNNILTEQHLIKFDAEADSYIYYKNARGEDGAFVLTESPIDESSVIYLVDALYSGVFDPIKMDEQAEFVSAVAYLTTVTVEFKNHEEGVEEAINTVQIAVNSLKKIHVFVIESGDTITTGIIEYPSTDHLEFYKMNPSEIPEFVK